MKSVLVFNEILFNGGWRFADWDRAFVFRCFGQLSLHAALGLPLLFFLPLHFLLTFLKGYSAHAHLLLRLLVAFSTVLPARFARLSRCFAIILS